MQVSVPLDYPMALLSARLKFDILLLARPGDHGVRLLLPHAVMPSIGLRYYPLVFRQQCASLFPTALPIKWSLFERRGQCWLTGAVHVSSTIFISLTIEQPLMGHPSATS
jgi:hypothetical protein